MDTTLSNQLFIPVFGGQGSSAVCFGTNLTDSLRLESSSAAKILVSSCYAAFHEELSTLDPSTRDQVAICASEFNDEHSILRAKSDKMANNPAFAWPSLLLRQLLRYLIYVESHSGASTSTTPFKDIMQLNIAHRPGVLGFSSGLLSACVVAASPSTLLFLNHAVEAYRLAFWIGIRSQVFLSKSTGHSEDGRSWAKVVCGINKSSLESIISHFNEAQSEDAITLTAVMGENLFTVSGHPDDLTNFSEVGMLEGVVMHEAKIAAPYHCSQLLPVRDMVHSDIVSRNICFPTLKQIMVPIRSTLTGQLITMHVDQDTSLAEMIIDLVLLHPVNWSLVLEQATSNIPPGIAIKLLDIGLGPGLAKLMERSFRSSLPGRCKLLDLNAGQIALKRNPKQEPIAIVGMAVNMPGAVDANGLWELLAKGVCTTSEVPGERFDFTPYMGANTPGRCMKNSSGNFIQSAGHFDNEFFNISPREAMSMDPQQRVVLQVAYHALEDAGYVARGSPTYNPETFGCFIGASTNDYVQNLRKDIDVYYSTGTLSAFLSGRISYFMGLSGPSMVIDTACSSSIVALHSACRSLINQDCHAALAGGINIITSPDMFIGLDRGHFLSPSGQCRPFDARADGYVRGEGCGVFVLKRLSDALAEQDQILGIIRGVEVNQSGKASSITHPHASTQAALFKQLLVSSDIDPKSVSVVEAHGTGTQAGDVNEMESIRSVLAVDRTPNNPLYITSVKANIGHLEAASGSASLAKVLMMFKNQIIPQQISIRSLNPRIAPLDLDNTIISTQNVLWTPSQNSEMRLALVNNFGASGSNAALLVEEYISKDLTKTTASSFIFGLSAKNERSLEELRMKYVAWLTNSINVETSLLDIAYTATARRQLYPYRLAVSCGTIQELVRKIQTTAIVKAEGPNGVAFIFSGQGHEYRGMASSLYATSPTFKKHIDECDSILIARGFSGIRAIISKDVEDGVTSVDAEERFQTATFALQYALAMLWMSWGVQPMAVVGHSLGEYAALVIAGVLSLKDGLLVVATRARLMFQRCPPMVTGMVAVSAEPAKLSAILGSSQRFPNVSISCINSPRHCTVSGPLRELDDFAGYLTNELDLNTTRLHVPYGYHSASMLPLKAQLAELGASTRSHPARIPLISTVYGCVIMPGDQAFPPPDYFALQCIEPVRFVDAMESYLSNPVSSGTTSWLEIGSHPSILPMLKFFPALSDAVKLGSLRMHEESWISLSKALASFYLVRHCIDWRSVYCDIGPAKCTNLPAYPFATQSFWVPFVEDTTHLQTRASGTKRNPVTRQAPRSDKVEIRRISVNQLGHYFQSHRIGNVALCPASVYLDLVSEAVRQVPHQEGYRDSDFEVVLHQIVFVSPMTYADGNEDGELVVLIDPATRTFEMLSEVPKLASNSTHGTGSFQLVLRSALLQDFAVLLPHLIRCVETISDGENNLHAETFRKHTIYQVIFPRVVHYSPEFHTMQTLSLSASGSEAIAKIVLPHPPTNDYASGILFLDTVVHIAGFIANFQEVGDVAYICKEISSLQVLDSLATASSSFTLYCKISSFDDGSRKIAETFALSDAVPRTIVARATGIVFQRIRLHSMAVVLKEGSGEPRQDSRRPFGPSCDIKTTISAIVANSCGKKAEDLSSLDDFDSLGIDSLMRIELCYEISKAIPGTDCRPQDIVHCNNVIDLVNVVSNLCSRVKTLASPHSSSSTTRTLVSHNHIPSPMRCIVARVLGLEENALQDGAQLSDLGLDSLSSIEAIHAVRKEYHVDVSSDIFTSVTTIRDLESHILSLGSPGFRFQDRLASLENIEDPSVQVSNPSYQLQSLSLLQDSASERTPLVLIHDGSGLASSYRHLADLGRRVWAISNPRLGSSHPWDSLVEMAQAYMNLIAVQINGPIIVGGWSFGGVVAFEITRQSRSLDIRGIVLIDAPCPLMRIPMPHPLIERVLDDAGHPDSGLRGLCKDQFIINAQLMNRYTPTIKADDKHRIVFLSSRDPYDPQDCDVVPSWFSDRSDPASIVQGWEKMAECPIKIIEIPGHHFAPFEPENVTAVSDCISNACKILDLLDYPDKAS